MTITILCAGALARPGAAGAEIEPDPRAPQAGWLPAARLRDEVRAAAQPILPADIDDGALARTLRRARVVSRMRLDAAAPPELPDESWLREHFQLDGTVAACTLAPSTRPEPEVIVRPVHLHPGLDHLVLAPLGHLAIADDEAQALAAQANHWLAPEGLVASPSRADAWRLRACTGEDAAREVRALGELRAPSARSASGRNIDAWQPTGDAVRRWRALNNLIQMSWFEHPVNAAREARGQLPINALWLEGRAGAAGKRPFDRVWTDDAAIAGVGRRAGADTRLVTMSELAGLARSHDGSIDRASADATAAVRATDLRPAGQASASLIAPGFWQRAMEEGDARSWIEGWREFERWFARAFDATLPADTLRLVLTGERDTIEILCEPADRWKAWRALRLAPLLEDAR